VNFHSKPITFKLFNIYFIQIDSLQLQLQMTTGARDQFEKQLHESLESLKEQREKNTQNHKEINELKQQAITQKCDMLYGGKGIYFPSRKTLL